MPAVIPSNDGIGYSRLRRRKIGRSGTPKQRAISVMKLMVLSESGLRRAPHSHFRTWSAAMVARREPHLHGDGICTAKPTIDGAWSRLRARLSFQISWDVVIPPPHSLQEP